MAESKSFWRLVWERKSLPPMWMWKRKWPRRVSLVLLFPLLVVLAIFFALLVAVLEAIAELRWERAADMRNWFKATWDGRNPYRRSA
jgi:hypothetical protein